MSDNPHDQLVAEIDDLVDVLDVCAVIYEGSILSAVLAAAGNTLHDTATLLLAQRDALKLAMQKINELAPDDKDLVELAEAL